MNIAEFMNLPEFDDLTQLTSAKKGMKFLHGQSMVVQKDSREIGQVVSFYEVTYVDTRNPKNLSYTAKMEKLTRPMEDEG